MTTSHGIFSIAAKDDQHNDNDDLCVSGDGVFALSTDIGWLLACLLTSASGGAVAAAAAWRLLSSDVLRATPDCRLFSSERRLTYLARSS